MPVMHVRKVALAGVLALVVGIFRGLSADVLREATCGCNGGQYTQYFIPEVALIPPSNWNHFGETIFDAGQYCKQQNAELAFTTADDSLCLQQYVTYLFNYYDVQESRVWVQLSADPFNCYKLEKCRVKSEFGYAPCTPSQQWILNTTDCGFTLRFVCQRQAQAGFTPPIPYIANAIMPSSSIFPTTSVTYTCKAGYEMSGSLPFTSQCSGWKSWTVPTQTCVAISCRILGSPVDGKVTFSDEFKFQSVASFSCSTGFTLIGDSTRTCNADKTWSGKPTTCQLVDCGEPPSLPNMTVAYNTTTYLSTTVYRCDVGYKNTTSRLTATCQATGVWDVQNIQCQVVKCGLPPSYANAAVQSTTDSYLSKAVYTCTVGYESQAPLPPSVCQADGEWQAIKVSCQAVHCPEQQSPVNGVTVYTNGSVYRDVMKFRCTPGFQLQGNSVLQCQSDKTWNDTMPKCNGVDCGKPPSLPNTTVSFNTTTYPTTAVYSCDTGYKNTTAQMTTTCQSTGVWDVRSKRCALVKCGPPPSYPNSAVQSTTDTYMSQAVYSCTKGYESQSPLYTSVCQADGEWQDVKISCTVVHCSTLTPPTDGKRVFYNGTAYRGLVKFACDPGFELSGDSTLQCQSNKSWNNTVPKCLANVYCPMLNLTNGTVSRLIGYDDNRPNTVLQFTCDEGFRLNGSKAVLCTVAGTWNDDLPICQEEGVPPTSTPPAVQTTPHGHPSPHQRTKLELAALGGIPTLTTILIFLSVVFAILYRKSRAKVGTGYHRVEVSGSQDDQTPPPVTSWDEGRGQSGYQAQGPVESGRVTSRSLELFERSNDSGTAVNGDD